MQQGSGQKNEEIWRFFCKVCFEHLGEGAIAPASACPPLAKQNWLPPPEDILITRVCWFVRWVRYARVRFSKVKLNLRN